MKRIKEHRAPIPLPPVAGKPWMQWTGIVRNGPPDLSMRRGYFRPSQASLPDKSLTQPQIKAAERRKKPAHDASLGANSRRRSAASASRFSASAVQIPK